MQVVIQLWLGTSGQKLLLRNAGHALRLVPHEIFKGLGEEIYCAVYVQKRVDISMVITCDATEMTECDRIILELSNAPLHITQDVNSIEPTASRKRPLNLRLRFT